MARIEPGPAVAARFGGFGAAGGYESFYLRAVDPAGGRAVWLRHTVHQAPNAAPLGSIWVTLFDAAAGAPVAHKATLPDPRPENGWLTIGDSRFGPDGVTGTAGPARWDLRWEGDEPPLRHLPSAWMYRTRLPKTKLESPHPAARFSGTVTVGETTFTLDGWPGMVGHNWGAEHAERWIWLHGVAFDERPDAWLDLSLGRVRLGPLTTPWVAAGALSIDGERIRLDARSRPRVRETPTSLSLRARAGRAGRVELRVDAPEAATVVWRYANPDGHEHHTANCSIAAMQLTWRPRGGPPVALRTAHGGAYELGMRETTHGLAVQPFGDP